MEANIVISVIGLLFLAIIMIGMGMSLSIDDFRRIAVHPRAVTLGTVLQMIILPAVGYFLALLFGCPPFVAVGIILLASCPGGVASNIVTHLSRGDTALSVTLTVISSFLTVITIPVLVNLALKQFMGTTSEIELPVLETSGKVFLITIPPILIGMIIRSRAPRFAEKSTRFVKSFSLLFLVFLIVGVSIKERHNLVEMFVRAGVVSIALCLFTAAIGFLCASFLKLDLKQKISITVEVGFQNSTLALVIATSFLKSTEIAVPPAVYTVVMYMASGLLIAYMNLMHKRAMT